MDGKQEIASALRHIGRGFDMLARALEGDAAETNAARYEAALRDWGERGLTREQASALLRKHGFAPQIVGAWARGGWINSADDGLRYLTERSHAWVREQKERD